VDNDTLRRILDNPRQWPPVERIEGWRSLGDNIIETIINKSEKVKELKNKAKGKELTEKQNKAAHRGREGVQVQAQARPGEADQVRYTHPGVHVPDRLPRNTLQDVITKLEPELFLAVTGLTVKDFHLLVRLKVFNTEQMKPGSVRVFRRYEGMLRLRYSGIVSHPRA
jgi:hypothetical protein